MAPQLDYSFVTDADIADAVALVESAYRGEASRTGWTSEDHLIGGQRIDAAMLIELLAEPGAHILLAREGDHLVACCELREPARPGEPAYFGMFAVDPSLQAGGYGRVVLAEAERVARDEFGAAALEMTVIRQRDALIGWYERRGYLRTGDLKPFPYGDDRYGLPKVADLEFAVMRKDLRA